MTTRVQGLDADGNIIDLELSYGTNHWKDEVVLGEYNGEEARLYLREEIDHVHVSASGPVELYKHGERRNGVRYNKRDLREDPAGRPLIGQLDTESYDSGEKEGEECPQAKVMITYSKEGR